jgi:serine/threonine-protein kinase
MERRIDGTTAHPQSCLDEQAAVDFASGAMPRAEVWSVEEHLASCDRCTQLVAAAAPHVSGSSVREAMTEGQALDTQPLGARPAAAGKGRGNGNARGEGRLVSTTMESGTALDDTYEIVGFLGRGAMGEVYEVKHARLAGRYAAKLLSMDLADNAQAFSRFKREAMIASGLSHPNIVHVIDFRYLADGRPFLVMEYLAGVDLGRVLAAGPLPYDRTLRLLRQIVSALSALHTHHIIHRDLKPQNIFVLPGDSEGEPERIKLVDFGLAKRANPSLVVTFDRTLLGTPQYMAPEQALGNSDGLGPESDQFSLAAIVYEMLSGKPPFEGEALSTVLYRIVHQPPPSLVKLVPKVPANMVAAIDRALSKDATKRFPSVKTFLQTIEGEREVTAGPQRRRQQQPNRLAQVLIAAAVAAGAIGAVIGARLLRTRDERPQAPIVAPTAAPAVLAQPRPREPPPKPVPEPPPAQPTAPAEAAPVVAATPAAAHKHRTHKERPGSEAASPAAPAPEQVAPPAEPSMAPALVPPPAETPPQSKGPLIKKL